MIRKIVGALTLMSAAVLCAGGPVRAQAPTLSDIVACNEQAAAKTMPSAMPDANLRARASEAAQRGPTHSPPEALSEKTDPSGSLITESPDPLVKGMDAGHAADRAYRAAYRQCMERRALR
jgi:hypothetical protein